LWFGWLVWLINKTALTEFNWPNLELLKKKFSEINLCICSASVLCCNALKIVTDNVLHIATYCVFHHNNAIEPMPPRNGYCTEIIDQWSPKHVHALMHNILDINAY